MRRVLILMAVFGVTLSGVWGCARGPATGGTAAVERIKSLEEKNARLEEDFRSAAAARDQFQRKLTAAEEQQARLLQDAAREREQLKQLVDLRTGERDAGAAQFEAFRKSIREALGQAEPKSTSASAVRAD
jgi:hypothetical protein